jgi:predicted O-methyltransferase YrrM
MSSTHLQITEQLHDYIRRMSLREPAVMVRLREETAALPNARMQVTPEQGQFLGLMVELMNAKLAVEVGVFTGYSALAVARCLPSDGKLIACDVSEDYTRMARRYWREAGVEHKIDLRLAPAIETLDRLLQEGHEGTVDFAFIDADKQNYDLYYEQLLKLLRPGGLLGIDNVLWHGSVVDPNVSDDETEAIRRLNQKISTDTRVSVSMLPIGDGLSLVTKRRD